MALHLIVGLAPLARLGAVDPLGLEPKIGLASLAGPADRVGVVNLGTLQRRCLGCELHADVITDEQLFDAAPLIVSAPRSDRVGSDREAGLAIVRLVCRRIGRHIVDGAGLRDGVLGRRNVQRRCRL
jgi:hypothetical protein